MNTGMIRIGILGCSDIASRKVIPALRNCRYAALAGVASRDPEKARRWGGDLNVKPYAYEGIVESPDIDMVYISLPNTLHKEWSIRSMENGKHVLCEKPLSIDCRSIEEIVESAGKNGKYLFEGLMYLHHPQHAQVKKLLHDGIIGEPVLFRSSFGFHLKGSRNIRWKKELGGGALLDILQYPVSAMRFFFDCEPVQSTGFQKTIDSGIDISGTACIAMENGVTGQISYGFNQSYECFYRIVGDKGSVFLDRCYTTPETMENRARVKVNDAERIYPLKRADHFALMIDDFCKKILARHPREEIYSEIVKQAMAMELVKKGMIEAGTERNA